LQSTPIMFSQRTNQTNTNSVVDDTSLDSINSFTLNSRKARKNNVRLDGDNRPKRTNQQNKHEDVQTPPSHSQSLNRQRLQQYERRKKKTGNKESPTHNNSALKRPTDQMAYEPPVPTGKPKYITKPKRLNRSHGKETFDTL